MEMIWYIESLVIKILKVLKIYLKLITIIKPVKFPDLNINNISWHKIRYRIRQSKMMNYQKTNPGNLKVSAVCQ